MKTKAYCKIINRSPIASGYRPIWHENGRDAWSVTVTILAKDDSFDGVDQYEWFLSELEPLVPEAPSLPKNCIFSLGEGKHITVLCYIGDKIPDFI